MCSKAIKIHLFAATFIAFLASDTLLASDTPASAPTTGDSSHVAGGGGGGSDTVAAPSAGLIVAPVDGVRYVDAATLAAEGLPTREGIAQLLSAGKEEERPEIARFTSVELRDGGTAYVVSAAPTATEAGPSATAGGAGDTSAPVAAETYTHKTAIITVRNLETGEPVERLTPVRVPLIDGRKIEGIDTVNEQFALVTVAKKAVSHIVNDDPEGSWCSSSPEVFLVDLRSGTATPIKLEGHKHQSLSVTDTEHHPDGTVSVFLDFDRLERTAPPPSADGAEGAGDAAAADSTSHLGLIQVTDELATNLRHVRARRGKEANVLLHLTFGAPTGLGDAEPAAATLAPASAPSSVHAVALADADGAGLLHTPRVFGFARSAENISWYTSPDGHPLASVSRKARSQETITPAVRSRSIRGAWEPSPREINLRPKHKTGNIFVDPSNGNAVAAVFGAMSADAPIQPYLLNLVTGAETLLMDPDQVAALPGQIGELFVHPLAPSRYVAMLRTHADIRREHLRVISTDPALPIPSAVHARLAAWEGSLFGDPDACETRILSAACSPGARFAFDPERALRAVSEVLLAAADPASTASAGGEEGEDSPDAALARTLAADTHLLRLQRTDSGERTDLVSMAGTSQPVHPAIFATVPGLGCTREVQWYRSRIGRDGFSDPARFALVGGPAVDDGLYYRLFVTHPPATVVAPGVTPATVVVDYGGPEAHNQRYRDTLAHVLASRGVRVVTVDHVGSTGYGYPEDVLNENWPEAAEEFADILRTFTPAAGTVHALGCSYGGYLVTKAATGSSITVINGEMDLAVADLLAVGGHQPASTGHEGVAYWRRQFGADSGTPEGRELLREMSPRTDATVPTLVLVGTEDKSVHPYAGRRYAAARHHDGDNIRLVEFPGAGHSFDDASPEQAVVEIDLILTHVAQYATPDERGLMRLETPPTAPIALGVAEEVDLSSAVFAPPYSLPESEDAPAAGDG